MAAWDSRVRNDKSASSRASSLQNPSVHGGSSAIAPHPSRLGLTPGKSGAQLGAAAGAAGGGGGGGGGGGHVRSSASGSRRGEIVTIALMPAGQVGRGGKGGGGGAGRARGRDGRPWMDMQIVTFVL